jgi:hypothetical protein
VTATAVTGSVRVDGEAVPGSDVLLFGPGERPRLLATAVTDAAGAFTLESDDDLPRAPTILAKLKGDPIGVLTHDVEPSSTPARVELDAAGPQHSITATM